MEQPAGRAGNVALLKSVTTSAVKIVWQIMLESVCSVCVGQVCGKVRWKLAGKPDVPKQGSSRCAE